MAYRLGELAVRFGLSLRGNPETQVTHVASLSAAGDGGLTFIAHAKLADQLESLRATAVVLPEALAERAAVDALISINPHADFARIATLLHPQPLGPPGVHPSAVVDPSAQIDPTAHIGAQAVIGPRVSIGARAYIGPGCVVGEQAQLAEDVRLVARVTVLERVILGARVWVQPGAVIGAEGFGYAQEGERWLHVPQVGTVRIGADVEIGANTTIDRGALDDTIIAEGVKIDNLVQIGHNSTIGAHSALAGCVGLAGSSHIGARCRLGGGVGVAGHLRICDDVTLTGFTLVTSDIREPGFYSSGIPASPTPEWRRSVARLKRLDRSSRHQRKKQEPT